MRNRTSIALLTVLLVLAGSATAAPALTEPPAPLDLAPDLRALPATDLSLQLSEEGRRVLRLTTEVANLGSGPLELRPAVADCDTDGDPRNDRLAYQRVFEDANSNHFFEPRTDTGFRDLVAGCMRFHPAHDHWHFRGFASYFLVSEANGRIVSSTSKVSFCAIDTDPRWRSLAGFRPLGAYTQCGSSRPQGLSVGWGDIYGAGLPGQALDVTRVGRGRYCLVTVADPQGRMLETNEGNNAVGTVILLRRGGRVHGAHRPCAPPPPPV
jgi:Lysyl oxidase